MLEFNNNHIFTGYLKQLLADFNLPKYKVYTQEQKDYFNKYKKELDVIESIPIPLEDTQHKYFEHKNYDDNLRYIPYIKDNQIQIYTEVNGKKKWVNKKLKYYFYNKPDGNNTKKLIIKNNIYDSYTHEYLGDYLRFQRDYNKLDLMPLYNCFSNNTADHLQIKISTKDWYYEKIKSEKDLKNNTQFEILLPLNKAFLGLDNENESWCIKVDNVRILDYTGYDYLPWKLPVFLAEQNTINNLQISTIGYDATAQELFITDNNNQRYTMSLNISDDSTKNYRTFYLAATFKLGNMKADSKSTLFRVLKNYLYKNLETDKQIVFDSTDTNYKIYSIPVKLFKEYTIAIDSSFPIELCCGIYNKYLDTRDKFKTLSPLTYLKVNSSSFSAPFIYDKLSSMVINNNLLNELVTNEDNLRLFLKIPASNNSSITILEGNYIGWNDSTKVGTDIIKNHSVINFENILSNNSFLPITSLQLLKANTGKSYPFADRLIEYLSGNVISHLENNGDNVVRIQKVLESPRPNKYAATNEIMKPNILGLWDNQIRAALYKYATTNKLFVNKNYDDILGYCDKDIEENYSASVRQIDNTYKETTIANIDIYTEIYNNIYDND